MVPINGLNWEREGSNESSMAKSIQFDFETVSLSVFNSLTLFYHLIKFTFDH